MDFGESGKLVSKILVNLLKQINIKDIQIQRKTRLEYVSGSL